MKKIIAGIIVVLMLFITFSTCASAIDPDEALPHYYKEKDYSPSIDPDVDLTDVLVPGHFVSLVDPDLDLGGEILVP